MIACWSSKGGSGTTVVAAVLALELARHSHSVIGSLDDDIATVLGADVESDAAGLRQWLQAAEGVPLSAVDRLLTELAPELLLLPPGSGSELPANVRGQAERLNHLPDELILDVGSVAGPHDPRTEIIEAAQASILVLRPCFLAVKRACALRIPADGFVLLEEAGRSLTMNDVEDVLGIPALATVGWDASVARLVDAGRMKSRLPRSLRPLRSLAAQLSQSSGKLRAG